MPSPNPSNDNKLEDPIFLKNSILRKVKRLFEKIDKATDSDTLGDISSEIEGYKYKFELYQVETRGIIDRFYKEESTSYNEEFSQALENMLPSWRVDFKKIKNENEGKDEIQQQYIAYQALIQKLEKKFENKEQELKEKRELDKNQTELVSDSTNTGYLGSTANFLTRTAPLAIANAANYFGNLWNGSSSQQSQDAEGFLIGAYVNSESHNSDSDSNNTSSSSSLSDSSSDENQIKQTENNYQHPLIFPMDISSDKQDEFDSYSTNTNSEWFYSSIDPADVLDNYDTPENNENQKSNKIFSDEDDRKHKKEALYSYQHPSPIPQRRNNSDEQNEIEYFEGFVVLKPNHGSDSAPSGKNNSPNQPAQPSISSTSYNANPHNNDSEFDNVDSYSDNTLPSSSQSNSSSSEDDHPLQFSMEINESPKNNENQKSNKISSSECFDNSINPDDVLDNYDAPENNNQLKLAGALVASSAAAKSAIACGVVGALIGGLTGALMGLAAGGVNVVAGAIIGATVGGGVGAGFGGTIGATNSRSQQYYKQTANKKTDELFSSSVLATGAEGGTAFGVIGCYLGGVVGATMGFLAGGFGAIPGALLGASLGAGAGVGSGFAYFAGEQKARQKAIKTLEANNDNHAQPKLS